MNLIWNALGWRPAIYHQNAAQAELLRVQDEAQGRDDRIQVYLFGGRLQAWRLPNDIGAALGRTSAHLIREGRDDV